MSSPRQSVSQCSFPPSGLDWWQVTPLHHPELPQSADRGERTPHSGDTRPSPALLEVGLLWLLSPEMDQTSPGSIDLTVNCVKLSHSRRVSSHLTKHSSNLQARLTEKACRRSCGGGFWTNHSAERPEIQGGVTAGWPIRREILKAETSGKNSYYNLTRRVELLSLTAQGQKLRIRSAATYNKEERINNKKY